MVRVGYRKGWSMRGECGVKGVSMVVGECGVRRVSMGWKNKMRSGLQTVWL